MITKESLRENQIYQQCTNENCPWKDKFVESKTWQRCQFCASPLKRVKIVNGEVKDLKE